MRKGDLLFTIDSRLIEAALAQAQANVAKDQVQVQQARAVLERDLARVAQSKAAMARDMAQLRNAETQSQRHTAEGQFEVAAVPSGDPRPVKGAVTFIDNTVDVATGTIRLKATFANQEGRLWPGQFANVTLTLASEPDAIVVPSPAVQSGQQGTYVFVVKPDSTVDLRRVAVARTQGSETVIAKGLQAGEKVVIDGVARRPSARRARHRASSRRSAETLATA